MKLARSLLIVIGLGLAIGCGGGEKKTEAEYPQDDEEAKVSDEGKRWGGWRWKGKRDDCFFLYDNACFDSLEKACKEAKCPKADCVHDDSAPAKVKCTLFEKGEEKDEG